MERIKVFSLWSGLLGFIVVALGAWTRLADAGLGCPDWPGCYGFVTIPVSPEEIDLANTKFPDCLLYTSPSPRDREKSRMPSSA